MKSNVPDKVLQMVSTFAKPDPMSLSDISFFIFVKDDIFFKYSHKVETIEMWYR